MSGGAMRGDVSQPMSDRACQECLDVGWVNYDDVDYQCEECLRTGRIQRGVVQTVIT